MINKLTQKVLTNTVQKLTNVKNKLIKVKTNLNKKIASTTQNVSDNFSPIMATNLKSIKQMQRFNKSAFGVKVFDIKDKEFGQFLTDGVTNFFNKTNGQFGIPKKTSNVSNNGYHNILTEFIEQNGKTEINLEDLNIMAKLFKDCPNLTTEDYKIVQKQQKQWEIELL